MKKKLLFAYRFVLGLLLFLGLVFLVAKIFLAVLEWLAFLYPPYSVWLTAAVFLGGGLLVIICDTFQSKKRKASSTPPSVSPSFYQETEEIVEEYLSACPYAWKKFDDAYTLFEEDHKPFLDIYTGNLFIEISLQRCGDAVFLCNGDSLEELKTSFSEDMDNILNDRTVQVAFFLSDGTLRTCESCKFDEVDGVIQETLPIFNKIRLWSRLLRLIFLFPQPKKVTEVRVISVNGIHDRVIPVSKKAD